MAHTIHNIVSASTGIGLDAAAATSSTATARNATSSSSLESAPSSVTDSTTLSPLGGLLSSSLRSASALSSFRAGRVTELKAAVASGTYQPDLGKVAERVAHALKGLGQ